MEKFFIFWSFGGKQKKTKVSMGRKANLKRHIKRNQREHPAHSSFNRLVLCFLLEFAPIAQELDSAHAHPAREKANEAEKQLLMGVAQAS